MWVKSLSCAFRPHLILPSLSSREKIILSLLTFSKTEDVRFSRLSIYLHLRLHMSGIGGTGEGMSPSESFCTLLEQKVRPLGTVSLFCKPLRSL